MTLVTRPFQQHTSDVIDNVNPWGERKRLIQNWLNHERVDSGAQPSWGNPSLVVKAANGRSFRPTASGLLAPGGQVDHQPPGFTVDLVQEGSPVQVYATKAATAPSPNSRGATIHARLASDPRLYVELQALDTEPGVLPTSDGNSITYDEIYGTGTSLKCTIGRHRFDKVIKRPEGSTFSPRFSVRQGPGCSFEISQDGRTMRFLDPDGVEYMHTKPAKGWWGAETIDDAFVGGGIGSVLLVDDGTVSDRGDTLRVFAKVQDGPEWAGASGPSWMDATTSISGTTDVDEFYGAEWNSTSATGTAASTRVGVLNFGAPNLARSVHRVKQSALPAKPYTLFQLAFVQGATGFSTYSGSATFDLYRLKTGQTWTESGASWDYSVGTTAWLGGGGLGAPGGSSYETTAGASYSDTLPHNSAPDRNFTITLPTIWATEWEDGTHSDYGFLVKVRTETGLGKNVAWLSSEHGTPSNHPIFTVTYPGGGGSSRNRGTFRGQHRGMR